MSGHDGGLRARVPSHVGTCSDMLITCPDVAVEN
jgi:hypothetical protein